MAALAVAFVWHGQAHAADGFANYNGTTTGGAGGPTVTVSNLTDLTAAIGDDLPRIVQVSGTINLGSSNVRFGSNKTIVGVGSSSGFIGNLKSVGETNVIIQNLNFTNPNKVGDGDGMTIEGGTHIWIDHCSFVDCGDGSLDIKRGSDLVTVSWCKFSYTFNSGHNFVNLIGHSDSNGSQDRGKLRITFHHNWWSTLCVERMPRVRFGKIHMYNNYFNSPGNNYCIRASIESETLAESNYFENVDEPFNYYDPVGKIRELNNVFVNVTGLIPANDTVFSPPYAYSPEAAANVKASVMAGAGTGGGTPPPPAPAAPGGLGASAVSSSQINLSWSDNSSNEDGFRVERSSDGVNFSEVGTTGSNATTFASTGLAASTTYHYRVRAYNSGGNSAYSNNASATTQAGSGGTLPAAPTGLSATAVSNSQINLAWTDNASNETGYRIERSSDGTNFSEIATTGAGVVSYANTGLTASTAYSYRVRAYNGTGNSGYSNTASATTHAGTGTGTTVTFVSVAAEDGRILESSESSGTGGSVDATGSSSSTLRIGDDNGDRQYKTVLSFDTSSLPDGATITAATVRMRRGAGSGSNPFLTHGVCQVDIKGDTGFSGSLALQTGDFQAAADATGVATMSNAAANGDWSSGSINSIGRGLINKTGKTQFRVSFTLDDNDDGGNDYVGYLSGNDSTPANRPVLEITYQ
jgi:pectate lyase